MTKEKVYFINLLLPTDLLNLLKQNTYNTRF